MGLNLQTPISGRAATTATLILVFLILFAIVPDPFRNRGALLGVMAPPVFLLCIWFAIRTVRTMQKVPAASLAERIAYGALTVLLVGVLIGFVALFAPAIALVVGIWFTFN